MTNVDLLAEARTHRENAAMFIELDNIAIRIGIDPDGSIAARELSIAAELERAASLDEEP
jgi:hypothetical protein